MSGPTHHPASHGAHGPRTEPQDNNNILLVVGQLLEATKAASEGIKSVSQEVRQHSNAIVTTAKSLETLERAVMELDRIVRIGGTTHTEALVHRVADHASVLEQLRDAMRELRTAVGELREQVDGYDHSRDRAMGAASMLRWAAVVIFQLVTLLIAVKAAQK